MSIRIAGQSFARPAMVKLHDQILTASGKFDVTGLPQGFKHLILYGQFRSDVVAIFDDLSIFLNGDTTDANYRNTRHAANVATHAVSVADNATSIVSTGASSPAGFFSDNVIRLPNYSGDATAKSMIITDTRRENATTSLVTRYSVIHWENISSPINRITIETDNDPTDELIADSKLTIYGIY